MHQICVVLLIYKTIFRLLYDTQNFISHTQHIVESSVLNSVDARSKWQEEVRVNLIFFSVKTNSKVPSMSFLPQFSLKFIHILSRLKRPLTWKWRFYPNQPKCFWPEICSWPVLKIGVFSVAISKHILSPCVHSLWILTHQDDRKVFPEDFISKSLFFCSSQKFTHHLTRGLLWQFGLLALFTYNTNSSTNKVSQWRFFFCIFYH